MDFITKIKTIIMKPKEFFAKVKNEKDFITPWKYYMAVLGIIYFVSFIAQIPGIFFSGTIGTLLGEHSPSLGIFVHLGVLLGVIFMIYILMAGLVFLFVAILHLFYLIVGAKKGYVETFKIISYTSTIYLLSIPLTLLGGIPIIGIIFSIVTIPIALAIFAYTLYTQVQGTMILHELTLTRAIIAVALPIFLIILFLIIIIVIVLIIGIEVLGYRDDINSISGMVTGLIN
jgi:hypothetical protein